jgi:hypothetical protein
LSGDLEVSSMNDQGQDKAAAEPPTDDKQRAEQGRKNREELDEPPPHGTDPLHEGP